MSSIALISPLNTAKFGGVPVYTAHLAKAFRASGYDPIIVRTSTRTSRKMQPFTNGESFCFMAPPDVASLADSMPSLIVCSTAGDKKKNTVPMIDALGSRGVPVVIHDPVEFNDDLIATLKKKRIKVITIREKVRQDLIDLGLRAKDVPFIPHPYVRIGKPTEALKKRERRAVYATRLCFRKNTPIVAKASMMVEEENRVDFWGAINRVCARHKLDPDSPGWRDRYHGTFPIGPTAAFDILKTGRIAIDLTVIPEDGEGTQYSFLEAWDAGTPLVVHHDWVGTGGGVCRENDTVLAVKTAGDLARILRDPRDYPEIAESAKQILDQHGPEKIIPAYQEALGL